MPPPHGLPAVCRRHLPSRACSTIFLVAFLAPATLSLMAPLLGPPENPCELHCRPSDGHFTEKLRDAVLDGTPCYPGQASHDLCVNGICKVRLREQVSDAACPTPAPLPGCSAGLWLCPCMVASSSPPAAHGSPSMRAGRKLESRRWLSLLLVTGSCSVKQGPCPRPCIHIAVHVRSQVAAGTAGPSLAERVSAAAGAARAHSPQRPPPRACAHILSARCHVGWSGGGQEAPAPTSRAHCGLSHCISRDLMSPLQHRSASPFHL